MQQIQQVIFDATSRKRQIANLGSNHSLAQPCTYVVSAGPSFPGFVGWEAMRCGLMEVIAGKVHLHGFRRRTNGRPLPGGANRGSNRDRFCCHHLWVRQSVLNVFPLLDCAAAAGWRRRTDADGEPLRFGTCAAVGIRSVAGDMLPHNLFVPPSRGLNPRCCIDEEVQPFCLIPVCLGG